MQYFDKNGKEIKAGMKILMEDGSIEMVYDTDDQYGNPSLGINASNEEFLKLHPNWAREYYTAKFLDDALDKLGLTRREANEFIVYWLPLMQDNPYNIISFQTDIYTNSAKLEINPAPDTLIRVFMAWQSAETYIELPKQQLTAPERNGFTVVEWGGTEMK